jgi:hypothetical protein
LVAEVRAFWKKMRSFLLSWNRSRFYFVVDDELIILIIERP